MKFINEFINNFKYTLNFINKNKILEIINQLSELQKSKGRLVIIGVGGSAANASHAVNDFRKLCNIDAYTPIDNISEITARTNDEGWENIFLSWLKVFNLNKKDKLLIFSVGGGNNKKKVSVNIIKAIIYAKKKKTKVISIVGKKDGYAYKNSDYCLLVPIDNKNFLTPISESVQTIIWHLFVSHTKLKKNKTKW